MKKNKLETFECPLEVTLAIIGGKYKINILFFLISQTLRFNELQKAIPKATPKMLSQQLKELEQDGLVNRVLYPVVPPKTEYSLSEKGETLCPIILALYQWGENEFKENGMSAKCSTEDLKRLMNKIC